MFLFYGENNGLKNDLKNKIISAFPKTGILNLFQDEIVKDRNILINEISNKSLFDEKKIIFINEANDKILEQAERDVPYDPQFRNTAHLYFDETVPGKPSPTLDFAAGDGTPINGISLVGSGTSFPTSNTNDGDYFLRTDFSPNRLFKKSGTRWLNVGTDSRGVWSAANRILTGFINNDNLTNTNDGEAIKERQNLSKVLKPKTDN